MPHQGNELRLPVMQRVVFEMSDQHHQNLNCRHQNHHRRDPARGGTFLPQSCQGAVVLFAKTGGATRAAARSASCRRRRTIRAALPKAPAVGQEAREIQPRFASKDSPPHALRVEMLADLLPLQPHCYNGRTSREEPNLRHLSSEQGWACASLAGNY